MKGSSIAIKDYYNEFDKENRISKKEWEHKVRIILSLVGSGKKVLDIGCGAGINSEVIKLNGNEVWGVDIAPNNVKACRKRGIKCIQLDVEHKEFPHGWGMFDVAYAGDIIEHIVDTEGFFKRVHKMLKPNGFIVVATPNLASLSRRLKLALGRNPDTDISLEEGLGHLRYFTVGSLSQLLKRCGFAVEECRSDFVSLNRLRIYSIVKVFPSLGGALFVKARKIS